MSTAKLRRTCSILALVLGLGLGGFTTSASAFQTKDPTDGFFDIPVDPNAVEEPHYGVPAYMITSALGGLAMFILCKSARRS